jgi:predicted Zn-dependent protease
MKSQKNNRKALIAAGSVTAAALLLSLVPFNMGGCSASNLNVTSLVQGLGKGAKALSLSEKDEPALGESVALQATNRYPIYQDQNLNKYVTLVGRTVGAASALPNIKYYFAILDTDQVNAFSGPHGFVFITRGALSRMKDESELAGVLGHEIGHICKHHGLNAVRTAATADTAKTLAQSDQRVAGFTQGADDLGDVIMNKGFSQPQEEEADQEGVKYAIAAGYNPDGYLHFLQRLQAEQGQGGHPFGTHPGIADRVKKVQDQIAKSGKGGQGASLQDRFVAMAGR